MEMSRPSLLALLFLLQDLMAYKVTVNGVQQAKAQL